jgi:hypothetical protein
MLRVMQFLAAVAIIIAAVVGAIIALPMRQGWRERSTVEPIGADGMPLVNPTEPGRRAGEFAE